MDILLLILASFYIGWNIGANDTANCIGTSVGSGIISYKRGIIIVSLFTILGAITLGSRVMETMGKGIVHSGIPFWGILIVLIFGGLVVTSATYFGIPVSTSQSTVGAMMGIGLATNYREVDFGRFLTILESWIICPLLALGMTLLTYFIVVSLLNKIRNILMAEKIIGVFVLMSNAYVAFSLGANNVANCVGPLTNLEIPLILNRFLPFIGGLAIVLGVVTFSSRVTETVGKNITPLDLPGAFSAQFSAAFGIHIFSILGVPVSTSQAIVGAVIGAGLARGIKSVNRATILHILLGWVLTPSTSAFLTFLFYRFLSDIL